jgi:hypothetical protein
MGCGVELAGQALVAQVAQRRRAVEVGAMRPRPGVHLVLQPYRAAKADERGIGLQHNGARPRRAAGREGEREQKERLGRRHGADLVIAAAGEARLRISRIVSHVSLGGNRFNGAAWHG